MVALFFVVAAFNGPSFGVGDVVMQGVEVARDACGSVEAVSVFVFLQAVGHVGGEQVCAFLGIGDALVGAPCCT